ncbi:hypothetical protein [Micromonospora sp. DT231]|uniref:hypothetical protein n=1 Tax=Micromonospora sp. DT231 TaxID=3416526 RepID=UPI003CF9D676
MSSDPTAAAPEPVTQPQPAIDPWSATSSTGALPTTPPTTPFPSVPPEATPPPAPPFPAPPAPPFPAQAAPPFPAQAAPPFPAQAAPPFPGQAAPPFPGQAAPPFSASPVPPAQTAPFSAPPAPPFSAPPAPPFSTPPFSGPPAQHSTPPGGAWPVSGPYPPALVSAHPAPLGHAGPEVVAVQIAEISVCPPIIRTPTGVLPLAGATWHVADYWQREEKVATWALVCAIVGFFCLAFFSLLFLLVKETRHHGTVQVTVTNGHQQYVARIPVSDQGQVQHVNNQVNYARSLSGR